MPISEESIKRATLQFLKSYYKFRPRHAETVTVARMDMVTDNGIAADGHLQFADEQGRLFTATFEASSAATSYEVRFRLQKYRLRWDAIAIAALLTTFCFSYFRAYRYEQLKEWGWGIAFFILVTVGFLFYFLYQAFFKNLHRYRSIFALEQFKSYHADEQWVAISDDIFPGAEDPAFKELKKQCVYNGFGLIVVDAGAIPQLLITPAREEIFEHRRKTIPFIDKLRSSNAAQKAVIWKEAIQSNIFTQNQVEKSLLRFHRPYWYQIALTAISVILTLTTFYRFMHDTDKNYVDERYYHQKQQQQISAGEDASIIDNSTARKIGKQDSAYLNDVAIKEVETEFTEKGGGADGAYMSVENGELIFYDCERLNLNGTNYIIQESRQPSLAMAQRRMAYLRQNGLSASCVWRGCFTRADLNYCIFFDLIYGSNKEANTHLATFRKELNDKHLDSQGLKVVSLNE
jgi:hypothetical protein